MTGAEALYLGAGAHGPVWAGPEQSVLVLGPPRSGKTSAIVVPTVLSAPGAVVSTSTKPDVLSATLGYRSLVGECLVFDPSGTVAVPSGARRIGWSPVPACSHWDDALLVARALVGAAGASNDRRAPADHWSERAEALLAPLLHAAALAGERLPTLLSWVDRRQPATALAVLDDVGQHVAADLLAGIVATESREQSGIWSTASGVLAGYRGDGALSSTAENPVNALEFCSSSSTLYVCATGRHQALVAPMVVGLLTEIRAAAYHQHARPAPGDGRRPAPVVLALDEVANIAPIPDLPFMVSEGGGQGLLTLACLQDLSQARGRWGPLADGFLSLFGTTVVLPGIGDVRTLQALSALAGEEEVPTRSVSGPAPAGGWTLAGRLLGRGRLAPSPTVTIGTRLQPRLAVDALGRGRPGMAMVVDERNRMGWVGLTPWFDSEPWRTLAQGHGRGLSQEHGRRQLPELERASGRGAQLGREAGAGP